MLIDTVSEQAALIEADIAGGAPISAIRVALHIFRHIKADEFDAERRR